MLDTLENIFHGQKTFRLVGGSLSWSETPYFHKGGPLQMGPKLPLSAKMQDIFFKEQYLGNLVTETPKMGLKLKIFVRT